MTATFKFCSDKFCTDLFGKLSANKSGRDTKNICIVMGSCKLGKFFIPANCGSDTLMFIGCDCYTIGAAANQYSDCKFRIFNSAGYRMCKVRIVYRNGTVGSKVFNMICFQKICKNDFVFKSCMICSYSDGYILVHLVKSC